MYCLWFFRGDEDRVSVLVWFVVMRRGVGVLSLVFVEYWLFLGWDWVVLISRET